MSYKVQTKAYSGPFDLLLQLVSRQKVAIGSISIADVADQYLQEVESMGNLDLDVASDFVLVASTLLDIKAASLVPDEVSVEVDEDALDDADDFSNLTPEEAREVLIARLIAYKQFRSAAANLNSRMEAEARMIPRTAGPDPDFMNLMPDYLEGIALRSLTVICADLDSKRESFLLEAEHVAPKRVPIALTVASVDRLLRSKKSLTFSELIQNDWRAETVVANFLAILELAKRGSVVLSQAETFGDIALCHVEGSKPYEVQDSDLQAMDGDIDG